MTLPMSLAHAAPIRAMAAIAASIRLRSSRRHELVENRDLLALHHGKVLAPGLA